MSDHSSHEGVEPAEGNPEVDRVVEDVVHRRARGEAVDDGAVVARHPHLAPALSRRLEALRRAREAFLAARRAGALAERFEPLSPEELDKPLLLDDVEPSPELSFEFCTAIEGYRIEAEISQGGQARVFRAVQETTGRTVAIKVIAGGPFLHRNSRRRFEREVRVLAALQHPNVVGILDSGRTRDGSSFLVMDYIDGEPLDQYLSRRRREGGGFGQYQVVQLFAKVCDALAEAHARGIVHRDLKPSNLRVDWRGEPHVLDFGLAHLTTPEAVGITQATVTAEGHVVGSLPWASPEQASGELSKLGLASDVYSLAVVMYQALTGEFPYPVGGTVRDLTQHIRSTPPRTLSGVPNPPFGPVAAPVVAVLLKALAKKPATRYPSARELGAELQQFLHAGATGAGVVRSKRSHRLRSATLCALAMCTLGTVGAIYWRDDPFAANRKMIIVSDLPRDAHPVGLEFVRVPLNEFQVGSPAGELGRQSHEAPYRASFTAAFWVSTTEVTRGQYRAVMGSLPPGAGTNGADDLPVDRVTWGEAREFCRRLGDADGHRYDLPTEAQWEYACRAGMPTPYAGNQELPEMGWYGGNSGGRLRPVREKSPNHWGIYDAHGGVSEWCLDGWEDRRGDTPRVDPLVPPTLSYRITKGGDVGSGEADCRSAARRRVHHDQRQANLGFRVVRLIITPPATAAVRPGGVTQTGGLPHGNFSQ